MVSVPAWLVLGTIGVLVLNATVVAVYLWRDLTGVVGRHQVITRCPDAVPHRAPTEVPPSKEN